MEKKLEVKKLQISFRTQAGNVKAVRDISFDLYKGETLAIVGESGSGKSVTSKAIIGILAGNSIVEGGEILYDGQDLLKISEDDFHKIRGDKISMIFQDPMSSLNPIMRVGKQLTEAMILNGKARQKHAKKDFNSKLKLLNEYMDLVDPNSKEYNNNACKTFDSFCINSTKLELAYNNAQTEAISLSSNLDNIIFLLEKNQKFDFKRELKSILVSLTKTYHHYVVLENDEVHKLSDEISASLSAGHKKADLVQLKATLTRMKEIVDSSINKEKPNYFRLGYYLLKNPNFDYSSMPVEELDKMTRKFLDEDFILEFINRGSKALLSSHETSTNRKKEILQHKDEVLKNYDKEVLDKKESYADAHKYSTLVNKAINRLSINKSSVEYSFASALKHALDVYFDGIKNNESAIKKYNSQKAKYDALVAKGKTPTWKVIPARTVNLQLATENIKKVYTTLFDSYEKDIESVKEFNANERMVELVDYLKELASRVVYKVTSKLAKARALELLKEVGIPEPHIRFKQYPFEFSGGMRQRIVIAIALSANPDILICDEPTTALDVTIQSQILELINKIKEERHLSVIFITHDLGVVANMADRIAVMYAGKIVEYGTSEDIFYDPRHPYTWALLSSMPDLETKEKLDAIPGTPPNMIYPPEGDAFAERNKYALQIDFEMQPPLFEISETHFAATWLLHPNAPEVNPPKIITDRINRMKKGAKNNGK